MISAMELAAEWMGGAPRQSSRLRLLLCTCDFKAVTYAPPIDIVGPEFGQAFLILEGLKGPTPLALQREYVSQETAEALVRRCPEDWRIVTARAEW